MIKELYQIKIKETALNVTQSKIDSIRKKDITKTGCRVYKDGFIGVAGTFGEATDETWQNAIKNLELKIPYEYEVSKDNKRIRDLRKLNLTSEEFVERSEQLLEILRKEFPEIIFSNKIRLFETETTLKNDAGLDYINYDKSISLELIFKHINSANVFDSGFIYQCRDDFDLEVILKEAREQFKAFNNEVELPNLEKVVTVVEESFLSKIIESLNGETIGRKTSIFANKVGTKAFSDKFTLFVDLTDEIYHNPFFDAEGSTLEDDKCMLIENGVILRGYTDKKNSKEFGFINTASASAGYDDVPSLGFARISPKLSDKTFLELAGEELVIFPIMASGGDCTSDGDFATPVQMAYLVQNGKFIGKLPEFSVSGNIYEMFGDDFIGVSKDKFVFNQNIPLCRMKISE